MSGWNMVYRPTQTTPENNVAMSDRLIMEDFRDLFKPEV
jgi:hypothetical protein